MVLLPPARVTRALPDCVSADQRHPPGTHLADLVWRDLPERFGPWKTAYEHHRLRSAGGTWEYLLQQIQAAADVDGEVDWDLSVGSTHSGL